jgi:hypothetical protein
MCALVSRTHGRGRVFIQLCMCEIIYVRNLVLIDIDQIYNVLSSSDRESSSPVSVIFTVRYKEILC